MKQRRTRRHGSALAAALFLPAAILFAMICAPLAPAASAAPASPPAHPSDPAPDAGPGPSLGRAAPSSRPSAPRAQADDGAPAIAKTDAPPVIDGALDDPVWADAATTLRFDGFKTFKPDFGKEPSQKTEAMLAYDAENLYFAFRSYDSEPSRIKAALCKRDNVFQDDIVFLILDTFNDRQGGFSFILNPLGIQGDGMMNVDGNLDESWDTVWFSKGRIDDQGWTVEARVPLKSIRFPNKDVLTMRVLFVRFFTRTSEQATFPPLAADGGSILGQSQPFRVSGLTYKRVFELLPAFTYGTTSAAEEGALVRQEGLDIKDLGLTGKFGITSDLTLDGAVNPDFSQVEADAGQVDFNLRYSLYYPEKRPFFLEGGELWQFGGAMEEAPLAALVYTRAIIDPAFGFKLTGKITPRDTVAAIYAQDHLPGDAVDDHPDFMIARYRHALRDDAYIGGFYTGREYGPSYNRVGGVDGRFRLSSTSTASFHLFGSQTKAPGAEEAGTGHALSTEYQFSNRRWAVQLGYQDISERFQADTGFLFRTGLRRLAGFAQYQIYPESKFFQKIEPFYWSYHLYDTVHDMWETVNVFVARFRLPRNTMVRFDGLLANEVYAGDRFDRSGFGFQAETQLAKQLYVRLFARRTGSVYYDPEDPYQGYGARASATVRYQPAGQLDFSLSLSYVDFYRQADREKIYDYLILRGRGTFQVNKYLFLRGIVEYNDFRRRMTLDGLISFTYIPGTVVHLGYGSALEKLEWTGTEYAESDRFLETRRGFFFKVSYLWRL
jgi:hypothetical protein